MAAPVTLGDLAREVAARLAGAGIAADEARLDAELLLRQVLGWDRARWIASSRDPAPEGTVEALAPLAARRVAREPMAYILGRCEFWGREFEVAAGVLVPRPETEILVEQALARIAPGAGITVVDVGTGSGCIAVSLALDRPLVRVIATDISARSIEIARRNARRHGVLDRIAFQHEALLGNAGTNWAAMIVSNPPYVPSRDGPGLQPEVRDHEPPDALFGGDDGLDVIRELIFASADSMEENGWLLFEFGFGQAGSVREILDDSGVWDEIAIVPDLQGIPRTAVARLNARPSAD
jgi:release factor glutamine methyltransferase